MSLIPVREALRALAGEGLVTYRPRRGYAVTELDLAELEEVYRLRRLLETDALRRGVGRATAADLRALEDGRRRLPRGGRKPATSRASSRQTGASTTGCTALAGSRPEARLIDLLWDSTEAYRALYYVLPGRGGRGRPRPSGDHRRGGSRRRRRGRRASRTPIADGRSSDSARRSGARPRALAPKRA